jgi:hypothetical protein
MAGRGDLGLHVGFELVLEGRKEGRKEKSLYYFLVPVHYLASLIKRPYLLSPYLQVITYIKPTLIS